MDILFEDSGKIIKKISGIYLVIAAVSSLICAIAFGRNEYHDFSFLPFIGIFVGGLVFSFISSLLLYAFGDITDNIKKMAASSVETANATKELARVMESSIESTSKPSVNSNSHTKDDSSNNHKKVDSMSDTWICKKCGTKNDKKLIACKDCGEYRF